MGFQEHDGTLSAAGIAYYVALALFPLLLVLVAGLGWIFEWTDFGQDVQKQLLTAIEQQVSPNLAEQVGRMLQIVSDRAGTSGPIGFVVLVISAVAIFAQVDSAFDRIWTVPTDPHQSWGEWIGRLLLARLKALGMLMSVGAFIVAVMIASLVWSGMQKAVEPAIQSGPWGQWFSNLFINLALNLVAFTAIYKFVPRVRIRWRSALRGGIVAAVLWEIGRQALAAYLLRLNYPTAYGVIGSFLAIMLWAYYASLVLLYGAEYLRVISDETYSGRQQELELG
jgi:membrane protein